ncbi:MAG: NAD(P)-binding protein [Synechococcus sp.]|nr:NAD(P)-binding protein [Synechococcus sp.]
MSAATVNLAVIGAGVSACALTARLRQLGWRGSITLVEAGRGVGGRAASRRFRHDPSLQLDHGAPLLTLPDDGAPALLPPLLASGQLRPWPWQRSPLGCIEASGAWLPGPGALASEGRLLRGWPAMENLALGLLDLALAAAGPAGTAAGAPPPQRLHGVRITGLVQGPDGLWQLIDNHGSLRLQAHWLVLSGTLLAHPRCLALLGLEEVPLQRAGRELADPALERLLAAVAHLRYDPRLALLAVLEGAQAALWRQLPFAHLEFTAAAQRRWGLERILLQPQSGDRLGLVVQAPAARFQPAPDGHGRGIEAGEEERLIAGLRAALADCLSSGLDPRALPAAQQCQLMRWGGAFPLAPGLEAAEMICPASRLALCGDAIAGPGFARLSGAWWSGEWLAEQLHAQLPRAGG